MPTTADNAAIVRRAIEEVLNRGNLRVIDELCAPNLIAHDPSGPDRAGREADKQFVELLRAAFPDLHFTIHELIAQGDTVVIRYTATGTHQGAFQGIPPTGRRATVQGVGVHHLENGRIKESWAFWDQLSLLRQLGVVPAPETASITEQSAKPSA